MSSLNADRAIGYCANSQNYLQAYQAIVATRPSDWDITGPKLQLLCHALELSMKGWLIWNEGISPRRLKKYGHDLAKLAGTASQYYPPFLERAAMISHANLSYWGAGKRDYEYPDGHKNISFVSASELAILVEMCNRDLSTEIHTFITSNRTLDQETSTRP